MVLNWFDKVFIRRIGTVSFVGKIFELILMKFKEN